MTCPVCGAETTSSTRGTCASCGEALPLVSGSVVASRYEIEARLGRGGMGTVYRARDRMLDEVVALKVLRPDLGATSEMTERFRSEIRLARKVTHRNVCRIHEYNEDGHLRYISMQFIEGEDLRQILKRKGGLAPEEAFEVAIQVADGLQAIHDEGIIHRDLKTPNIMRDGRGVARLMDFGIAKHTEDGAGLTMAGQIVGTPEYMSPEQVRGEKVDFRSDVYALGIVVFELFTGQLPFKADTPLGTLLKQIEEAPPLEGERVQGIPEPVLAILARALAKNPEERYASAEEMGDALRAARATTTAHLSPASRGAGASGGTRSVTAVPGASITGSTGAARDVPPASATDRSLPSPVVLPVQPQQERSAETPSVATGPAPTPPPATAARAPDGASLPATRAGAGPTLRGVRPEAAAPAPLANAVPAPWNRVALAAAAVVLLVAGVLLGRRLLPVPDRPAPPTTTLVARIPSPPPPPPETAPSQSPSEAPEGSPSPSTREDFSGALAALDQLARSDAPSALARLRDLERRHPGERALAERRRTYQAVVTSQSLGRAQKLVVEAQSKESLELLGAAIQDLTRAVEADPSSGEARTALADAVQAEARLRARLALVSFTLLPTAVAAQPNSPPAGFGEAPPGVVIKKAGGDQPPARLALEVEPPQVSKGQEVVLRYFVENQTGGPLRLADASIQTSLGQGATTGGKIQLKTPVAPPGSKTLLLETRDVWRTEPGTEWKTTLRLVLVDGTVLTATLKTR